MGKTSFKKNVPSSVLVLFGAVKVCKFNFLCFFVTFFSRVFEEKEEKMEDQEKP